MAKSLSRFFIRKQMENPNEGDRMTRDEIDPLKFFIFAPLKDLADGVKLKMG